jgi:hypothetical protein
MAFLVKFLVRISPPKGTNTKIYAKEVTSGGGGYEKGWETQVVEGGGGDSKGPEE